MKSFKAKEIIKLVIDTCEAFKKDSYKYSLYILAVLWFKYQIDNFNEDTQLKDIIKSRNSKSIVSKLHQIMISKGLLLESNHQISNEYFQRQGDPIIGNLIEQIEVYNMCFTKERLEAENTMKEVFTFLIDFFAKQLNSKEKNFYTPISVRKIVRELVNIDNVESIYDIACGSGSILTELSDMYPNAQLYGQENREDIYGMCQMNMWFHTSIKPHNEQARIFSNKEHLKHIPSIKADLIVGNLLFFPEEEGYNKKVVSSNKFFLGEQIETKGEYALILHALQSLKEDGQAILIVSHGVLFRLGNEQLIRKQLVEKNVIDSIIGLPGQMFYGIENPPCILVLNKKKSSSSIIFIDASQNYSSYEGINKLDQEAIARIGKIVKEQEFQKGYSYKATLEEIKKNDYNLNISRYVTTISNEEKSINKIADEIIEIENKLNELKKKTDLLMLQA